MSSDTWGCGVYNIYVFRLLKFNLILLVLPEPQRLWISSKPRYIIPIYIYVYLLEMPLAVRIIPGLIYPIRVYI